MNDKIRKHIFFYGRVQGVGFRNLYDGSVEMEVQGDERSIDELIMFLENQRFILIERMDAKSIKLEDDYDFYER